jgi:hypothetical protein
MVSNIFAFGQPKEDQGSEQHKNANKGKPEDKIIARFRVKRGRLVPDANKGYLIYLKDAAELEDAAINMKASYYSDLGTLADAMGDVFGEDACYDNFKERGLGPAEVAALIVRVYGVMTGKITDDEEVKIITEQAVEYGIPMGEATDALQ